jgi:hypothetical protein
MINPKLANWITATVTAVWVINFVAVFIPQLNYKPDPLIHAAFTFIVGGSLALKRDKDSGDKDGDK